MFLINSYTSTASPRQKATEGNKYPLVRDALNFAMMYMSFFIINSFGIPIPKQVPGSKMPFFELYGCFFELKGLMICFKMGKYFPQQKCFEDWVRRKLQ